jgi:activator of 2-hydroxyglutaryl-CoA dehydratase
MENIADRLDVSIEEFADLALESRNELNLPGKCGIFLSSAVVSRKNMGYSKSDILMGVCRAMIRNYLSVCGKNAELAPPYVFRACCQTGWVHRLALNRLCLTSVSKK